MLKRHILIFIIMVMVTSLGQIMSDMYLPSLPAIGEGLKASHHLIQLSLSVFMFGFAISLAIYGPLSDGIGRRIPLIIGLVLCLVGSIFCISAQSITGMIIGRLLQGLGAGATLSITQPILRDLFDGKTLAKYSSYSALIGVGFLTLAPLIGGYLQYYFGWRASFLFVLIYSLAALAAIIFLVPETNKHRHPLNLTSSVIKKNLKTVITSPTFIGYCVCSLLAYGALLAWLTSGPIVLQSVIGLSPVSFGWVYVLTGIGFAMGAVLNAKCVNTFGINKMMVVGLLCVFLSGIGMSVCAWMGVISSLGIIPWAVMLLFGVSMVFPNTSAGVFQPFPEIAGITSAIFYSTRVLSGSIFSFLVAVMPSKSQLPMGLVFIFCSLLALIIFRITSSKSNERLIS